MQQLHHTNTFEYVLHQTHTSTYLAMVDDFPWNALSTTLGNILQSSPAAYLMTSGVGARSAKAMAVSSAASSAPAFVSVVILFRQGPNVIKK